MAKRRCDWTGTLVVMVTPFLPDGALDTRGAARLADMLFAEGADGLVVAGSTGEWFSLSNQERVALFAAVKDAAQGRGTLIAGISAIGTADAVAMAEAAKGLGYQGGMLLPPPYILPTERELMAYVAAVDAAGLPLMLYNNPPRTGVNLNAGWMRKLLAFNSVVAMKDSVKDIAQTAETICAVGEQVAVFTGLENYAVPLAARGAAGVVAMAPNVMGALAMRLYAQARAHAPEADTVQARIDLLYHRMYLGTDNPYAVMKACMNRLGRPAGNPRPPLLPVADMASIDALLVQLGCDRAKAAE